MVSRLSHVDEDGKARMVDVSAKAVTERSATAKVSVLMQPATLDVIRDGRAAKGDVLAVARLAGIMAAKRTDDLIPLCHSLPLTAASIDIVLDAQRSAADITAECRVNARTGVEMEALTAAAVAALTLYDMVKAIDRGMRITDLRLVRKEGGRSGLFEAP